MGGGGRGTVRTKPPFGSCTAVDRTRRLGSAMSERRLQMKKKKKEEEEEEWRRWRRMEMKGRQNERSVDRATRDQYLKHH